MGLPQLYQARGQDGVEGGLGRGAVARRRVGGDQLRREAARLELLGETLEIGGRWCCVRHNVLSRWPRAAAARFYSIWGGHPATALARAPNGGLWWHESRRGGGDCQHTRRSRLGGAIRGV